MKMSPHIHRRLSIKNHLLTLLILLLIAVTAWLTHQYPKQIDLTTNLSNSLSKTSEKVLLSLTGKVKITAYINQSTLQPQINHLLNKYRQVKNDISLKFIDPATTPDIARDLNIGPQGLILVEYHGRTEKVLNFDEPSISNALFQLANTRRRLVSFLTGHGERAPTGQSNADLDSFTQQLKSRHINFQTLNVSLSPKLPEQSTVLVLAAPQVALLPKELDVIFDTIRQGNNLLLLTDPGNHNLRAIEDYLGIYKLPGMVVSDEAALYDLEHPKFLLLSDYPQHTITQNFKHITLFPYTAALSWDEESNYQAEVILSSSENSWTETNNDEDFIQYQPDSAEKQGPLAIAYALIRNISDAKQQRIVIIGDSDFLSNAYFSKVGNAELSFRIINWLLHDDQVIEIPPKIAPGQSLHLSAIHMSLFSFIFLLAIPLLFLITGFVIRHKRKTK